MIRTQSLINKKKRQIFVDKKKRFTALINDWRQELRSAKKYSTLTSNTEAGNKSAINEVIVSERNIM